MTHRKGSLILVGIGLMTLGGLEVAVSGELPDRQRSGWVTPRADIVPVANTAYGEECGSCHLAYQPGLLPAQAWAQVMDPAALGDHYGDDASLAEARRTKIARYLAANSADQASGARSRAFAVGFNAHAGSGLPRITETRYFKRKHDEVPASLVTVNPEVGSFGQCPACHRSAAKGIYHDSQIDIPGHGPWKD
ncbi:diheme cytochrome c [Thiocystis violacea]|uniref:diheme cytochrome c n=1 Tax=Thiocystis violacea TaxID=13725 RepID=UPI0019081A18|nr:diheme cytochrome c [Thiocystis violacea]MBK1717254.1 cytochrome C [Thiocystis violacea]